MLYRQATRSLLFPIFVVILLLLSISVHGETEFFTTFSFVEEYNDNIFYEESDEIESFISIYNPGVTLRLSRGKNSLFADYSFFYTDYEDETAKKYRSKDHHSGNLNFNYFLNDRLHLSVSSWHRYSDAISLIDIDHELVSKERVLKSYNTGSLEYDYKTSSSIGIIYRFVYFKYYAEEFRNRERNNTQTIGGFWNHSINSRNSIRTNYNYYFGKYFTNDGDKYIGRRKIHDGNVSYAYRINQKLTTTLSLFAKSLEFPYQAGEGAEFQTRKHYYYEARNTLGYDITDFLTSSYWIGYNTNKIEYGNVKDNYQDHTGGLRFDLTWRRIALNAQASYEIKENLFYTVSERLGDYRSIFGGLNVSIGKVTDPLILNLYVNGRNNRYRTTRTMKGEIREDEVYYWGGQLKVIPLDWLYFIFGYNFAERTSNVRDDVYGYTNNRLFLQISITFPTSRMLPTGKSTIEREAIRII